MAKIPKVILLIENSRTYGRDLLRGIGRYARFHGPWSFYMEPEFYVEMGGRITKMDLSHIRRLKADGIIMRDIGRPEEIIAIGIPTIIVAAVKEKLPGIPTITTDDAVIGKMAAKHLLDRGFRHFGYCGFDDMSWSRKRKDSFKKAIAKAGFKTYVYRQPGKKTKQFWEKEQHFLSDWLKSLPKPMGLMVCNDNRGRHITEACKMIGLNVPAEVALIGVDNDELLCELSTPQLSSIALNVENGGYNAAKLLDKMMAGKKATIQTIKVNPTHVVTRQSTDIFAVEDREVAEAMQFIRLNANSMIQVSEVVGSTAVSRRCLEKRFHKFIGHSIHDEIKRCRIEQIVNLLIHTETPLSKITMMLNFPEPAKMSRYFKCEKGISPLAYRKRYSVK